VEETSKMSDLSISTLYCPNLPSWMFALIAAIGIFSLVADGKDWFMGDKN
jgi:hypothetical protein